MEWGEQRNALIALPTLSTSHPLIAPLFLSLNFPFSHFASFMCSPPSHNSTCHCSSRLAVCLCAQLWFLNSHICTYMRGNVYYCIYNIKKCQTACTSVQALPLRQQVKGIAQPKMKMIILNSSSTFFLLYFEKFPFWVCYPFSTVIFFVFSLFVQHLFKHWKEWIWTLKKDCVKSVKLSHLKWSL